jgi:hypothetical protein
VNIIDRDASKLQDAVAEMQRFRSTVGKETQHRGGKATAFAADDRKAAMKGAWLVVEVSTGCCLP